MSSEGLVLGLAGLALRLGVRFPDEPGLDWPELELALGRGIAESGSCTNPVI